eukprot:6694814-Alexandrium_andersonii.AAC.1
MLSRQWPTGRSETPGCALSLRPGAVARAHEAHGALRGSSSWQGCAHPPVGRLGGRAGRAGSCRRTTRLLSLVEA